MDKVDLPRVYNIIDTVEWQGCERDRKRSDYRKRPILDEPAAPLLIIPRYIVAPHCNNVWCIHKERTPTQGTTPASSSHVGLSCVFSCTHTGGRAGGGPRSMHPVEECGENGLGLPLTWRKEREREKELYARTTYVVTLRSTHGSKGFTDGIPHTRREGHIGRGSHTVSHDLLACHPPDLLSSSSHGWSKIQRSVPYITSLSARSSRRIDSFFPRTPAKLWKVSVWCRSTTVHPPCFTLCSPIICRTRRHLIITSFLSTLRTLSLRR